MGVTFFHIRLSGLFVIKVTAGIICFSFNSFIILCLNCSFSKKGIDDTLSYLQMNGLLFFLSTLGVFHGLGLSIYLIVFNKKKTLSKYLLGALILALSIRIGKSVLLYFDRDLPKIYLQIGLSACLFIGPLLYFYLQSVIKEHKTFPRAWTYSLTALLICIIALGIWRPYQLYPEFWNAVVVQSIYAVWFISVLMAGYLLVPTFRQVFNHYHSLVPSEKWLCAVYLGNAAIAAAFFLAFFGSSMAYYISGPLVFSFFLYLMGYGYFNNKRFENIDPPRQQKYQNKKIDQHTADAYLDALNKQMNDSKLYANPALKLQDVAAQLAIPKHQLSQLLNDNLGKSFKTYLNEHRVLAACDLMQTDHNLSLEGIGYEVGFRSKSTFFTTFKKIMQLTPAQYHRENSLNAAKNGSVL